MGKREQTKERILSAAWELFETQGYQETSTRQIARQAGVADGTVFSHFENKLAILREGMLNQLTLLAEQGQSRPVNGMLEAGMQFAATYYGYYFSNINLSRALLKEVIWDMDYYQSYNDAVFAYSNLSANPAEKIPLFLDCYFMTLITHLSKPEPSIEAALKELECKYRSILNNTASEDM
ncbi:MULTISPECIES: TetR/AcrR family transcriptional regulator [Vibrio]|uniref:TetR/AcrR family transcriptional regulator n=1 Tax=Vibrio TaxID=662 RepID=UPI001EFDC933|nr:MULTISPECIES: TetR/AcrR family transcriptional regulator [Vibrio]MCG9678637.1 TetR/AcrR family transcriptional regulator [Vibrio sp. Isolate24]USD31431.1 TetR/AcrR family transcriptional regulator [Vibrio sp. SCSIO 43186]USD44475.1 TetR/AcrR family transcriptional regulator [Vibrio sp. SCSIO 43145]USD68554.1 TetR/AcrR family transcriptional regulator [Vibrio sp. SCSIO 43139]USD96244.1 TetR family transcriptional regulator [Vibrio coralliilyticus]